MLHIYLKASYTDTGSVFKTIVKINGKNKRKFNPPLSPLTLSSILFHADFMKQNIVSVL